MSGTGRNGTVTNGTGRSDTGRKGTVGNDSGLSALPIRLSVIFVQYDREKYVGSLERLLHTLHGFANVSTTVVVVDNANPGEWYHQVSASFFHIGGDNSSWEFSAFDQGVAFLGHRQLTTDVFAFVTDAYLAYGSDYLDLLNASALRVAHQRNACVGWIDSFSTGLEILGLPYQSWLRTSFLIMDRQVYGTLAPLAYPIREEAIFGSQPHQPFAPNAPLSAQLQQRLLAWLTDTPTEVELAEAWHSRFPLTEATFGFFKSKVLAILREHLLSARLRAAGVPCFDLRILPLRSHGSAEQPEEVWQWLEWMGRALVLEPKFSLDVVDFPVQLTHGQPIHMAVEGWVASQPQVREVRLQVGEIVVHASCDRKRPDMAQNLPEYSDEPKGFRIALDLSRLGPGTYPITWSAPGTGLEQALGEVEIHTRCDFELHHADVARSIASGGLFPFSLAGLLSASTPLEKVEARWNGERMPIVPSVTARPSRDNGLFDYDIRLHGALENLPGTSNHVMELSFEAQGGHRGHWRHHPIFRHEGTTPCHLVRREIGAWDPHHGTTPVHIRGSLYEGFQGDRITLKRNGEPILEETLTLGGLSPAERISEGTRSEVEIISFELKGDVRNLPPGPYSFELLAERADGRTDSLSNWQHEVCLLMPEIQVDCFEAEAIPGIHDQWCLRLIGWVRNHQLTRFVQVEVDGQEIQRVGLMVPRPDATRYLASGLSRRQGFHTEVPLLRRPGPCSIRLVAVQDQGPWSDWRGRLMLEQAPQRTFVLESPAVERLLDDKNARFWSAIALGGTISHTAPTTVRLEVDGELVDKASVDSGGGDFVVTHVPERTRESLVRLEVRQGKTSLYDTGTTSAEVVAYEPDKKVLESFERVLEDLEIHDHLPEDLSLQRSFRWLASRFAEGFSELPPFLDRLATALRTKPQAPVDLPPLDLEQVASPLDVLFAAWEVPCRRHGGGVAMLNLLRGLSERGHRITLVHGYSFEEAGWAEDAADYVEKTISVPRLHRAGVGTGHAPLIPVQFLENYTPELTSAIQQELASRRYDLVDFEYSTMAPHIPASLTTPHMLSDLELGYGALLTTAFEDEDDDETRISQLEGILRSIYFYMLELPRRASNLVTVTQEDALGLLRLAPKADVFVNTLGVDVEYFEPPTRLGESEDAEQNLIFLGNYRHPPNILAVEYFADKVFPKVSKRFPKARFSIIGSHAPTCVQELGDRPGIDYLGFVDDFRPRFWRGNIFVAPIFTGLGMRVKLLEAMACGIPVVGTDLALRGTGARDGKHCKKANTADAFVEGVSALLDDPARARNLGRAGRKLVQAKHSVQASAIRREQIWSRISSHRPGAKTDVAVTRSRSKT